MKKKFLCVIAVLILSAATLTGCTEAAAERMINNAGK